MFLSTHFVFSMASYFAELYPPDKISDLPDSIARNNVSKAYPCFWIVVKNTTMVKIG